MSHFSDQSVITLNMFYINSSHHPNTLVIISLPVDTGLPFPLSLQSSCAKPLLTACYSMMIYIRPNVIQTGLCFVCLFTFLFCYFACLYCMFILWLFHFAFDKVLLKNFTTSTTYPNFTRFSAHVTDDRGSVLLGRQCSTLCTSGFVDDVMFSRNGANGPESKTTRMFRLLR